MKNKAIFINIGPSPHTVVDEACSMLFEVISAHGFRDKDLKDLNVEE